MSIIIMFLASALVLPVGLSYAQDSNVTATAPSVTALSNQTGTNKTSSNATQVLTPAVNNTKAGQQISDFVHKAVADFKQQGIQTRQIMLDCRDKIQAASPGDIDKIRADCTIQLSSIKAKYQDERNHFHDLVKQYRQSVMVFLKDARGLQVGKAEMDNAFANLSKMMQMTMPSGGMPGHVPGLMAAKNNTRCVNPPHGPAIC